MVGHASGVSPPPPSYCTIFLLLSPRVVNWWASTAATPDSALQYCMLTSFPYACLSRPRALSPSQPSCRFRAGLIKMSSLFRPCRRTLKHLKRGTMLSRTASLATAFNISLSLLPRFLPLTEPSPLAHQVVELIKFDTRLEQ